MVMPFPNVGTRTEVAEHSIWMPDMRWMVCRDGDLPWRQVQSCKFFLVVAWCALGYKRIVAARLNGSADACFLTTSTVSHLLERCNYPGTSCPANGLNIRRLPCYNLMFTTRSATYTHWETLPWSLSASLVSASIELPSHTDSKFIAICISCSIQFTVSYVDGVGHQAHGVAWRQSLLPYSRHAVEIQAAAILGPSRCFTPFHGSWPPCDAPMRLFRGHNPRTARGSSRLKSEPCLALTQAV